MNDWEIKYAFSIKKSSKNISVLLNLLNCQTDERLHFIQKNNTHNHTTFRRTSNLPQKGNVDFLQLNSRPTTPRSQIRLPNNVRYIYSEWHQGRTRRAALIDRLGIGNLSGCRIAKTALAEDLLHCIYLFFTRFGYTYGPHGYFQDVFSDLRLYISLIKIVQNTMTVRK